MANTNTRRVVALAIASGMGLLGIASILSGVRVAYSALTNPEPVSPVIGLAGVIVLVLFLVGGLLTWLSYKAIWKHSLSSSKALSAMAALILFSYFQRPLGTTLEAFLGPIEEPSYRIMLDLIPFLLMIVVYFLLIKTLSPLTQGANDQTKDPGLHR